jgi:hypothetical protein
MSGSDFNRAREEFLIDSAQYFFDKKTLYLNLKEYIAGELALPLSMVRVCGSAYWGRSFLTDQPFQAGESDLDVAVIDGSLYVRALSETRQTTWNFSNLTAFPTEPKNAHLVFQDYAYKKGIIRTDLMPRTKLRQQIYTIANTASARYKEHFGRVSVAIYDSESSFSVKQIQPTRKFRVAAA